MKIDMFTKITTSYDLQDNIAYSHNIDIASWLLACYSNVDIS